MTWRPREHDLAPYTQRALDSAYRNRERQKCSRDDFADGYMAALIDLRSSSSFAAGRWMPDQEDELPFGPLPEAVS